MNTFISAVLVGLVGVFCMWDSRLLGRLNFEQPLVGATLVGLLLGDVPTGLAVGAAVELVSMGLVQVGAAVPPDMVLGGIVAAAFACLTDASAETAMTIAIPVAVLGQLLGIVFRSIIAALTHVADSAIDNGKFKTAYRMHICAGSGLYAIMYFLPIFLANSAAKKFGCNPQMAMLLGAILLHPNFIALKADADVVHVLGLPVKMVTYSSSVIPIFLITLVLPYVERFVNKVVPSVVKFILRPVLTILIMAPISLCVLGPLGSIIGDGLVSVLLAIEKVCPWALPTVIGAFMPFLVMTGMHYSLLPAYVNSLSMLGYETVIGPGNLPSNIAQGAAALCVAIKTKNKNFRQLAVSGGVTALLGVTEPALFGVNVRLRKPLIATTIGGGLGGLYAGLTGVRRFGGGGAGLAAIGLYVGENPMNVVNALISAAIAFIATFAILWFIGFDDVPEED